MYNIIKPTKPTLFQSCLAVLMDRRQTPTWFDPQCRDRLRPNVYRRKRSSQIERIMHATNR